MVSSAAPFFSNFQGVKSPREFNRLRKIQEMAEKYDQQNLQNAQLRGQVTAAQLAAMQGPKTTRINQGGQVWEVDVDPRGGIIPGTARLAGQPRQGGQQVQGGPPTPQPANLPAMNGTGMMRAPPPQQRPMMPQGQQMPQQGFNQRPRSPAWQKVVDEGYTPGTKEFIKRITELNNPKPGVSITNKSETEEAKGLAGLRVKDVERINEDAYNSEDTLSSLNQMESIDVETGAFEPLKVGFASAAKSLGFDDFAAGIANVTNAQSFNAIAFRLVNAVLNEAKGPQTEGDAQRARSTIASLEGDPNANKFIIATMKANALRKIEKRDFYQNMMDDGATVSTTRKAWKAHMNRTPNLSSIVKDPSTGLPVYFYQFKQRAIQNRPNVTQDQIVQAWRQVNAP